MKKIVTLLMLLLLFASFTGTVSALNTPGVGANHGVITGMLVSDSGIKISGEYGVDSQLAIIGTIGDPYTRLGAKYEVDNNLAILGGIAESSPFIGINGSRYIRNKITGAYELNVLEAGGDLSILYELGVKYNLEKNIDLRAGFIGFVTAETFPKLELGMAYKF